MYKDQCVKCFAEYGDDYGINVCLKTLNGGCEKHSMLHY